LNKERIDGGYFIIARKLKYSGVYKKPPHFREIWLWLLGKANYKECDNIKRGSLFTSYKEIQEELSWYVGYRKEMYSKTQIAKSLRNLYENKMIVTMKTTRGMIITICNYDYYQDPKNYESNSESDKKATRKQQCGDTIRKERSKNVKNDNNDNKRDIPSLSNTYSRDEQDRIKKAKEIIKYLNQKANKKFPEDYKPGIAIICEQLKAGKRKEEFKRIIDIKIHDPHFKRDRNLLRPETLFKTDRFDTYLIEKPEDYPGYEPIEEDEVLTEEKIEQNRAEIEMRIKYTKTLLLLSEKWPESDRLIKEQISSGTYNGFFKNLHVVDNNHNKMKLFTSQAEAGWIKDHYPHILNGVFGAGNWELTSEIPKGF